ncbi:MAG: hypothetical protein ACYTGJ_03465 [Planctomycetota bacterium]|jgi:hypothetical protein
MAGSGPTRSGRERRRERQREEAQEQERWRREQEDRIALIEGEGGAPAPAPGDARNFLPGAPSRQRRLRGAGRLLLLGGYLLLGIALAGVGLSIHFWREGQLTDGVMALLVLGALFLGCATFILFKSLAELLWSLAEQGDQRLDSRNLLVDIRDALDRKGGG